jgi:phosphopantetheinyl transferase (holo-ACP synthase)
MSGASGADAAPAGKGRLVHWTHWAWAPVAHIAAERERFAAEHCTETERAALAGRHVQSLAGTIALKAALVDLLSTVCPDLEIARRHVEIGHEPGGAPKVLRLPVPLPTGADGSPGKLFVSVTHTNEHAIGLAVLELPAEEP